MSDEQPAGDQQAAATPADTAEAGPNVESLRVTVDANGMVVPDGDPAGQTVLTGQAAADAIKATGAATKAQEPAETKARKAAPEDKAR